VRCDFHISFSCRAKKRPSPVWVTACSDFVCYLAWLHHPVAVGRLRPTLIRGRASSSANDTTGGTIAARWGTRLAAMDKRAYHSLALRAPKKIPFQRRRQK
jgi:hypothetical protein